MSRLRALTDRVGRRGYALLFFCLVDVIYGWTMAWPTAQTRAVGQYAYADSLLPLRLWGVIWLVVAAVCLVQAFMRQDRVAFAMAIFIKLAWAAIGLAGWLSGDVPRGHLAAVVWAGFAGLVAVMSSWPEPAAVWAASPSALVTADSRGRIVGWNRGAEQLFGWRPEQVIGRPLTVLVPEELRHRHQEGFTRAVRERRSELVGRVMRFEALRRDGSHVPIELTISMWDANDDDVCFIGLVRRSGS
jgi:PAS domain S-box-containing protein